MGLAPSKKPPKNQKSGFRFMFLGVYYLVGKSRKNKIFKNVQGYFSQVGKVRNSIFSLSLSLRRDGGMGFPALAPNGYVVPLWHDNAARDASDINILRVFICDAGSAAPEPLGMFGMVVPKGCKLIRVHPSAV